MTYKACELAELSQEELETLVLDKNKYKGRVAFTETDGTFGKKDFLDIMEKACYLPRSECGRIFDLIFYLIIKNIYYGKKVVIPKFGNFTTYIQPPKKNLHVASTGNKMTLMARAKMRCVPSRYAQALLNPLRAEKYASYPSTGVNFKDWEKMKEWEADLMTDPFEQWR